MNRRVSIPAVLFLLTLCHLNLNAAPGDKRWQLPLAACAGAPAVATNGDLLVGSYDGNLYSVRPSGSVRWGFQTPHNVVGVPVVAPDGTIYFGSDKLYALNPDGSKRWDYTIPEPPTGGYVPYVNTPTLGADGVIYIVTGTVNALYSVTPDGSLRWEAAGNHQAPGAIGADGTLYLGLAYGSFSAVDMDGVTRWSVTVGNDVGAPAALAADGTVLVPVAGSTIYEGAIQALTPSGSYAWRFEGGAQTPGRPVVGPDGAVYYGFDSGRVVALETNGTLRWEYMVEGTVGPERIVSTPALAADGTLYVTGDHWLHALDASGHLLWRFDAAANYLGDPLIGPDGTVYFAVGNGALFAVEGTGAPLAPSYWPMAYRDPRHSASVADPLIPPAAPTNVTASVNTYTEKVALQWTTVPRAAYYVVLRGTTPAADQATNIASGITGAAAYDDRSATPGVTYYYFVCASNAAGMGPLAGPVQGQRRLVLPGQAAWIFPTGGSLSGSPSIGPDGTTCFCSSDGYLYAADTNGLPKWSFFYGGASSSTPSVGADGTVYFSGAISRYPSATTNALFAVDAGGHLLWRIVVDAPVVSGFAIAADGTVYAAMGDYNVASHRRLVAYSPSGSNLWTFAPGRNFTSTPVIGADGTIYAGTYDGYLVALRPDGTQLWESNLGDGALKSPVIGANGVLFLAGSNFHAVNTDGQQLWSYTTLYGADSGPACVDPLGTIYAQCDYTYYTLNPAGTNTTKWALPSGAGSMIANLVRDATGTLYLPAYSGSYSGGKMFARSSTGAVQWEYDSTQATFGSPTLAGNTLYAPGSDGSLYALRTAAGLDTSAWPHPLHDPQHTGRASQALPIPLAPSSVSATLRTRVTDVRVSWATTLSATAYDIFRASTTNVADAVLLGSITGQLFFDDKTAVPETSYTYWVRARNSIGTSPFSLPAAGMRRQAVSGELLYEWTLAGTIIGSPAIGADGTVYVSAGKTVAAVRPDGTTLWTYTITGGGLSSPTIGSDGTIYAGVQASLNTYPKPSPLLALNPDGTKRWDFTASDNISGTPALGADGTIYFTTDNNYPGAVGSLYAISPAGKLLWSLPLGSAADSSLAVGRDGTIYAFCRDGHLHAVTANGLEAWNIKAGTAPNGDTLRPSLALGADGTIYIGAGGLKSFNPDGMLRWQSTAATFYSTPVLGPASSLIASAQDSYAYLYRSGTNAWRALLGTVYRGAAAFSSDGLIYLAGTNGTLLALTQTGSLAWQTTYGSLWSSGPTIAPDGTIYVGGTDGKLRSIFGTAALADAPWPMFQRDIRHTGRDPSVAGPPATPAPITASDGDYSDRVRVIWPTALAASYYELWRSTSNDVTSAMRLADRIGGQTNYDDTTAFYGTNYYYWVRGVNGVSAGSFSPSDVGFLRAPLLAADIPAATLQNRSMGLDTSKLVACASNSLPYTMSVSAVSSTSTNGGSVSLSGSTITYTPKSGFVGTDRFTYTITDGHGGTAIGTVIVQVRSSTQLSANMLPLVPTGNGGYQVSFAGVPGRTYTLQRATTSSGPWTTLASVTVASYGVGTYTDNSPPAGSAYYRTTYP